MSKTQFRILMLLTVVSGIVGGALSDWLFRGLPARAAAPQVIEAQEFRLVDSYGKKRAVLQFSEVLAEPELSIYDAAGQGRVSLKVMREGPYLDMCDAAGKSRAGLWLDWEGPRLGRWDAAGELRTLLRLLPGGSPSLALYDAAGLQRFGLYMLEDGAPNLCLYDTAGKRRTALRLLTDGSPSVVLWDDAGATGTTLSNDSLTLHGAAGKTCAVIGSTKTVNKRTGALTEYPESTVTLFKENGDVLWQAP